MDEVAVEEPTGFASIRDQIRAEREAIASEKTLDLLVPGYSDLLAVRYRSISDRELEQYIKRAQGEQQSIGANLDLLIQTCETILYRESDEQDFTPALDENGDKIRFDIRLAEMLGIDANTARETVSGFFSPDGAQPLAVAQHIGAVADWLQGKSSEIDPALLGN
jgi:hypothetical protein